MMVAPSRFFDQQPIKAKGNKTREGCLSRPMGVLEGEGAEIAIPRGRLDETCPIVALQRWLAAAEITEGLPSSERSTVVARSKRPG